MRRGVRILGLLAASMLGIALWRHVQDDGDKEDCESHLQSSAYLASANRYLSVWKIYCVDSYAALHAIGPGEYYSVLAMSDRSPPREVLNSLPEGKKILRSDRPIKLRLVGNTMHVHAEPSDFANPTSELGKLGIVIDAD